MNIKFFVPLHFSAYSSFMHIKFMFGSNRKEGRRKENFGEFFEGSELVSMVDSMTMVALQRHTLVRTSSYIFKMICYEKDELLSLQHQISRKIRSKKATINHSEPFFIYKKHTRKKNENKIDIPLSWKFARQCLDRH